MFPFLSLVMIMQWVGMTGDTDNSCVFPHLVPGWRACLLAPRGEALKGPGHVFFDQHEVAAECTYLGMWQRGRLHLAVNQAPKDTVVRIHPSPPYKPELVGEGCNNQHELAGECFVNICMDGRVVEGSGLQTRRRKSTPVRIWLHVPVTLCTDGVMGSRAALRALCRKTCGFDSHSVHHVFAEIAQLVESNLAMVEATSSRLVFRSIFIGGIAQLAEQPAFNRQVLGSSPSAPTIFCFIGVSPRGPRHWSLKSAVAGSNPATPASFAVNFLAR